MHATKLLSLRAAVDQALANAGDSAFEERSGVDVARIRELASEIDRAGLFQLLGATGHHLRFASGDNAREHALGFLAALAYPTGPKKAA
jgi:hypothetical protein